MIPASQIKRHFNGLLHHNINDEQGFSALIVVNTPALDDSGVSHAVEHLVFRRSAAFNLPESLFQLTSLTDLSINASTHSNITYYHCHSQNRHTCLLGLNYLLNGLLAPEFVKQDLAHEIYHDDCYGVINRELSPQQLDQQAVIARSDTSAQRCYQYGGDIELITQLTLSDITRYHAQYYQAPKMHLLTGNIEPSLIASVLESINNKAKEEPSYCPKALPKSCFLNNKHNENNHIGHSNFEAKKQLVRWYIAEEFYTFFSKNFKRLSHLIASLEAKLISPQYNLNINQQFTLDIIAPITCSETTLSEVLSNFILSQHEDKRSEPNRQAHKFSPEIFRLFNYYQTFTEELTPDLSSNVTKQLARKLKKQSTFTLGSGTVYPLQKKPRAKRLQKTTPKRLLPVKNILLKQLSQHVSGEMTQQSEYKHRPLPAIFSPLFVQAQQQLIQKQAQKQRQKNRVELFDEEHSLTLINIEEEEQNVAILTSFIVNAYPSFLASRTQGHCYAIVCQFVIESPQLAFYSAYDVAPYLRFTAIRESLKILCKDLTFINATLPLAKSKLKGVGIIDIATGSVAEFISQKLINNDDSFAA
ncbi:peptidase M16 family protein [Colwellia psychrerythraea]|uniref:Peptidase M16 domain protein n=1 Tax=Colwellia psychrerythraea TaxID=28229 RepID=A0A099K990_COLPS|nr:insulinase family protein [Colwellia psychrerythraea]KGJ86936.1 peptidase M16 domain protein [Colwellia psychrerythraea]